MTNLYSQLKLNRIPVKDLVFDSASSAPSSPINGQVWYDTATQKFKGYEDGVWTNLIQTSIAMPEGSDALLNAGTDTVMRIWSAKLLRDALNGKANASHGHAAADVTSGTFDIARLPVASSGTSNSTQVVRADDSRLTNSRAPSGSAGGHLGGTYPNPTIAATLNQIPTATGNVSLGSNRITSLADPVDGTDAMNLNSTSTMVGDMATTINTNINNLLQGLDAKESVKVATTANITLSGTQTIDVVAVAPGDFVLVKDQTTASQNGIYTVASGAWSRRGDVGGTWSSLVSAYVWVQRGNTYADTGWVCTVDEGGTLGSTAITWTQFTGAGQISVGPGLTKIGNSISVTAGGIDTTQLADAGVTSAKLAAGAVDLSSNKVTGVLPFAKGGTGHTLGSPTSAGAIVPELAAGVWTAVPVEGLEVWDSIVNVTFLDLMTIEKVELDWKMSDYSHAEVMVRSEVPFGVFSLLALIQGYPVL